MPTELVRKTGVSPGSPFRSAQAIRFDHIPSVQRHCKCVSVDCRCTSLPSTPLRIETNTLTSLYVAPVCWNTGMEVISCKLFTTSYCPGSFEVVCILLTTSLVIFCKISGVIFPSGMMISPAAILFCYIIRFRLIKYLFYIC